MLSTQSSLRSMSFAGLLVLTSFQVAVAQKKEGAIRKEDPVRQQIVDHVMADFRETAQAHLLVQVDEMQKICKLSDSVAKRLKVAAKGAAGRYVKPFEAKVKNALRRQTFPKTVELRVRGKVIKLGPQKKVNKILELFTGTNKNFVDIGIEIRSYGIQLSVRTANSSSGHGFGGGGLNQLAKQPIWRKTFQRLVTNEQRKL